MLRNFFLVLFVLKIFATNAMPTDIIPAEDGEVVPENLPPAAANPEIPAAPPAEGGSESPSVPALIPENLTPIIGNPSIPGLLPSTGGPINPSPLMNLPLSGSPAVPPLPTTIDNAQNTVPNLNPESLGTIMNLLAIMSSMSNPQPQPEPQMSPMNSVPNYGIGNIPQYVMSHGMAPSMAYPLYSQYNPAPSVMPWNMPTNSYVSPMASYLPSMPNQFSSVPTPPIVQLPGAPIVQQPAANSNPVPEAGSTDPDPSTPLEGSA